MSTSKLITGIYTLTALHCGTGQASGAVDLPVAREHHTGLPVLPSTSLKGACRSLMTRIWKAEPAKSAHLVPLFGRELSAPGAEDKVDQAGAGDLIFQEGQLLALPVRSLARSYAWVTSALVLERFDRLAQAFGLRGFAPEVFKACDDLGDAALVADATLAGATLVLEDRVFAGGAVRHSEALAQVASRFAGLLPAGAGDRTRARLQKNLVLVPDDVLIDLATRTLPVHARIQLTGGKTTDKWKDPDDPKAKEESGNLWYEEVVPADTLFAAFVTGRGTGTTAANACTAFEADFGKDTVTQLGGNETVGQGRIWWTQEGRS